MNVLRRKRLNGQFAVLAIDECIKYHALGVTPLPETGGDP
ncbi:uncharacterized protein METZ01_LOCUS96834, partial [marine metagenome]